MDVNGFLKVFDRLLPRGRAWNLVFERPLKKFFRALSAVPKLVYEHICSIFLDMFPVTTSYPLDWSNQFGHPSELSISQLDAEWAQKGGQSPRYLQDKLHEYGLTMCFVHEWWVPDSDPVEARNPIALVETSEVLVNDIGHIEKDYLFQFEPVGADCPQFQDDGEIYFGGFDGYRQIDRVYPTPDIPTEYPNYFYVCGETWPEYAIVPASMVRLLKRLIYKIKPMHLRCILRIVTYDDGVVGDDYDIQDTFWHETIFQDNVSDPDPDETIQDYT